MIKHLLAEEVLGMELGATTDNSTAPIIEILDGRRHLRKLMWSIHRRKKRHGHSDETGVLLRVEVRIAQKTKGGRDRALLFGVVVVAAANRAWVPWDVACHPKPNRLTIQAGK